MKTNHTLKEMVTLSWEMLKTEWTDSGPTKNFVSDFLSELRNRSQLATNDVLLMFLIAVLFTLHRYLLSGLILKPLGRYLEFTSKDQKKFLESGCKVIYYSFFFSYEYYLVNTKYPQYTKNLATQWEGWYQQMPVPRDILYIYLLEAGFYFHSIYASIFMDAWKKDSIAMLFHHVLANSLIIFSLTIRYHCIGLIVLYLHDIADVFLEGTKIIIFFKNRKSSPALEVLSAVGFLSFTFSWFWCRLCLYPQIVLFSSFYVGRAILPDAGFYFFFNIMLWMLYCLNVYWFHFIVALIIRIASGKSEGVEDTREYREKTVHGKVNNGYSSERKEKKSVREVGDREKSSVRLRHT